MNNKGLKALMVILGAVSFTVLVLAVYKNTVIKKQWETPVSAPQNAENNTPKSQESSLVTSTQSDNKADVKSGTKSTTLQYPIEMSDDELLAIKPSRCKELMEKDDNTEEEREYLRNVCSIPLVGNLTDNIKIIKWWKDEDGNVEMMGYVLQDMEENANYPGLELTGIVEPLKNMALESRYYNIRAGALAVLYRMDRNKTKIILKEAIKREAKKGKTNEEMRSMVFGIGEMLSEEGEYEFAFPYMMKAGVFYQAIGNKDTKAIPFLISALHEDDDYIRTDAAMGLLYLRAHEGEAFEALVDYLKRTNKKAKDFNGRIPAQRSFVIRSLGAYKDKRAVPVLEDALKYEDTININYINEALINIKGGSK